MALPAALMAGSIVPFPVHSPVWVTILSLFIGPHPRWGWSEGWPRAMGLSSAAGGGRDPLLPPPGAGLP